MKIKVNQTTEIEIEVPAYFKINPYCYCKRHNERCCLIVKNYDMSNDCIELYPIGAITAIEEITKEEFENMYQEVAQRLETIKNL